jgi:NNP family nitrate/nitrite transporter-like MFS transporter
MVAFGWQSVAQVWAAGLLVTAVVCFWFTTKDDPTSRAPRVPASEAGALAR